MATYTKEFLVDAFASRYKSLGDKAYEDMYILAYDYYDTVPKQKFRDSCSLDADAIKKYKLEIARLK